MKREKRAICISLWLDADDVLMLNRIHRESFSDSQLKPITRSETIRRMIGEKYDIIVAEKGYK